MCLLLMTHENPSESQRYSCKQFLRLNHEQNGTLVLKLRKRNFALFVSVVKYISSVATKITWCLFFSKGFNVNTFYRNNFSFSFLSFYISLHRRCIEIEGWLSTTRILAFGFLYFLPWIYLTSTNSILKGMNKHALTFPARNVFRLYQNNTRKDSNNQPMIYPSFAIPLWYAYW